MESQAEKVYIAWSITLGSKEAPKESLCLSI